MDSELVRKLSRHAVSYLKRNIRSEEGLKFAVIDFAVIKRYLNQGYTVEEAADYVKIALDLLYTKTEIRINENILETSRTLLRNEDTNSLQKERTRFARQKDLIEELLHASSEDIRYVIRQIRPQLVDLNQQYIDLIKKQ